MERLEKIASLTAGWLNWVAIIGFVVMTGATVIDVVAAKMLRIPVMWSFDLTGLLGMVVLVFALAYTQVNRKHIEIEFVSTHLSLRIQHVFGAIAALVGAGLFAFLTWQMADFAMILRRTSRVTSIAEIPLAPFAYGAVFCFFVVFLVLLLQLLQAITEVAKK